MKGKRLGLLLVVLLTMAPGFNGVWAADYPSKPINFLIPFGPGTGADLMGRTLASGAEKYLGQTIVPVNKPGAAGGIMYSALKASRPDGYTVGWNSLSILTTTNIGNVPFKYDAFDHVCMIGYTAMPIAVRSDAPWKTFQEFATYAKANPGKIKVGNAGTGSGTHLTAVLVEKELKTKMVHVPLGAQRRVPSLLGGEVQAICVPLPGIASQVQSGQVRVLLMNTEERNPMFPECPTLKELGCTVLVELFRGISMPKGTPKPIIHKLAGAFEKGAQSPDFKKVAKKNGFNIRFLGAEEFQKYLKEQNEVVAEALKLGGLVK